jgi:general secretion pathway protein K
MNTTARLRQAQRGAALLLAMLVVTLVATLAAGMVWQQWQAVEVEGAERARTQASWLVQGAVDWARLILRTDGNDSKRRNIDSLDEVWATPLQDVKLSDFLAADRNNTTDNPLEAVLSGQITDAQARYNLRNLVQSNPEDAALHLAVFKRLCDTLGLPADTAPRIATGLRGPELTEGQATTQASERSVLTPQRPSQLAWLGLDADTLARLGPYVSLLPTNTQVNINTAPPEVLMAVIAGLDRATAERLLKARLQGGFATLDEAKKLMPAGLQTDPRLVAVATQHFEILGELRYDTHVLRELTLVRRQNAEVTVLRREVLPYE